MKRRAFILAGVSLPLALVLPVKAMPRPFIGGSLEAIMLANIQRLASDGYVNFQTSFVMPGMMGARQTFEIDSRTDRATIMRAIQDVNAATEREIRKV